MSFALLYNNAFIEKVTYLNFSENPTDIAFDSFNKAYINIPNNAEIQIISQNNSIIGNLSFINTSTNYAGIPTGIVYDSSNNLMYISIDSLKYDFVNNKILEDCGNYTTTIPCQIIAINTKNNTINSSIPITNLPDKVSYNPSNGKIYVLQGLFRNNFAQIPGIEEKGKITIVSDKSNSVVGNTSIGFGRGELKFNYSPIDKKIFVLNEGFGNMNGSKGQVLIIDANNNTLINTIKVGVLPNIISFNPTNDQIYVGNQESMSISVISSKNETLSKDIPLEGIPTNIQYNPFDNNTYITTGLSNFLYIINSKNQIIDKIALEGIPNDFVINPINNKIYITNSYPDYVSVFDIKNKFIIDKINLKMNPINIKLNPVNGFMYITNKLNNTVAVIDPTLNNKINTKG